MTGTTVEVCGGFQRPGLGRIWRPGPVRAAAHRGERLRRLVDDLADVDLRQHAATLDDAPVDHDRIDVRWLRRLDEQMRRLAEHAEIHGSRVDRNQVRALAGRQRADLVVESHRTRTADRRKLEYATRGELEFVLRSEERRVGKGGRARGARYC